MNMSGMCLSAAILPCQGLWILFFLDETVPCRFIRMYMGVGGGRRRKRGDEWGEKEIGLWVVNTQCNIQMMWSRAVHLNLCNLLTNITSTKSTEI